MVCGFSSSMDALAALSFCVLVLRLGDEKLPEAAWGWRCPHSMHTCAGQQCAPELLGSVTQLLAAVGTTESRRNSCCSRV